MPTEAARECSAVLSDGLESRLVEASLVGLCTRIVRGAQRSALESDQVHLSASNEIDWGRDTFTKSTLYPAVSHVDSHQLHQKVASSGSSVLRSLQLLDALVKRRDDLSLLDAEASRR
jgi:hypothetical protein